MTKIRYDQEVGTPKRLPPRESGGNKKTSRYVGYDN